PAAGPGVAVKPAGRFVAPLDTRKARSTCASPLWSSGPHSLGAVPPSSLALQSWRSKLTFPIPPGWLTWSDPGLTVTQALSVSVRAAKVPTSSAVRTNLGNSISHRHVEAERGVGAGVALKPDQDVVGVVDPRDRCAIEAAGDAAAAADADRGVRGQPP